MPPCHIYIYGDIVSLQAPNLGRSGAVSLTSVKDAYNSNSACDEVVVHIHSNGGSVFEGFAIHDFLVNTGKKITTIVEGLCCSIATVIFMAGTERKLTENSRFLIHNPWGNGEGDAAYFRQYANELQDEQARLLNFYKQQTGASTQLLQSFMNAEKLMSPQQAVDLKFATAIIDTVKAMALYRNHLNNPYNPASPQNQTTLPSGEGRVGLTTSTMDKNKKSSFQKLIAGLKNLVGTFDDENGPKAAVKTLADDGGDIYFDGELAEGTPVFDDEVMTSPCADGDYQFDDGTQITVSGGLVTVIDSGTQETQNSTQLQTLKAKVAALEAEKLELENSLAESATVMAGATKALQVAKSTYKPATRENKFNHIAKRATETDDDIKAKMEERRAAYKKKK